jgi:hypothetical protein
LELCSKERQGFWEPPETGRDKDSSLETRDSMALPVPRFQISSPQNVERINFSLSLSFFFFSFWWDWGLNSGLPALYCLSHTSNSFCSGYFGDGVSWMICFSWPQTSTLPISASQVARIIAVSHRCLAKFLFFKANQFMALWHSSPGVMSTTVGRPKGR